MAAAQPRLLVASWVLWCVVGEQSLRLAVLEEMMNLLPLSKMPPCFERKKWAQRQLALKEMIELLVLQSLPTRSAGEEQAQRQLGLKVGLQTVERHALRNYFCWSQQSAHYLSL